MAKATGPKYKHALIQPDLIETFELTARQRKKKDTDYVSFLCMLDDKFVRNLEATK